MQQTKGQSLIEEIKHPPDEATIAAANTTTIATVHPNEGHLPATIRSRVHSPCLSSPPLPPLSLSSDLLCLRRLLHSLLSTAINCWCVSPSHLLFPFRVESLHNCRQPTHFVAATTSQAGRRHSGGSAGHSHGHGHGQSPVADQWLSQQQPVLSCSSCIPITPAAGKEEAGESKRRKRKQSVQAKVAAGNLQLLISAAVKAAAASHCCLSHHQQILLIFLASMLLLICSTSTLSTTASLSRTPIEEPPSAKLLAESFFIVQFPSSAQLAAAAAPTLPASASQLQKWPKWSAVLNEKSSGGSGAGADGRADSSQSGSFPLLSRLLGHVISHPWWTLATSLLMLSFALCKRLMSSASCTGGGVLNSTVHQQKLPKPEQRWRQTQQQQTDQGHRDQPWTVGVKRQEQHQHQQHLDDPSRRPHSSLISRYALCLLVSCLCLLLPTQPTAALLHHSTAPSTTLLQQHHHLAGPVASALTAQSSKMRMGLPAMMMNTVEVPNPLPFLSGGAGGGGGSGDNVTATQICPLFLAPDGDTAAEAVAAQSDGVGRVSNSSSALSSEPPQAADQSGSRSAASTSPSGGGVRNPCLCYGNAESSGIFVACTSASMGQLRATLRHLQPYRSSVRSLSLYRLNESRPLAALPENLFESFSSISELHISSNFSQIGNDLTFAGLEESLRSLSFVNSQITTIPKSALSKLRQLQSLDIQANRIATLNSYAFYGLPLRTLNLQNNIIEDLHEFAFGGLENTLEELSLIGNRLADFPLFALRRLRKLLSLKLQSNLITQIPDDGFTRFTLLETLDLQSNAIRHLSSRSFITMPKLKTLYASNNLLTVVSDSSIFAQLHYLETLDLSLNRLRVVNLDGLESVRTLDLSYNHLHDLRLQGMLGLRELFASHNNILQLVNETFLNCSSLEVLYLQHNSIHSILYNAFHRLNELRVLDLSYNQLRQLHSALFKYTSQLESLNLDHNLISDAGLESGIFQELVELRELRLQRNLLKHIRKGVFYSLPNLLEIDLQMNEIESIESLESLANLQHINLQGNRLATFSGNVLSSFPSSLKYLQLSHNRLETLQNDTFRGQTELEVIWLNHNRLKRISVNIFTDQINLEKLHLDNNEITAIEENAFASLRNLLYLNLEHNQLNHLNSDIFRGLEMLTELRLGSSEIIGIEPNVMANLSSLQTVHLSNNQIYTIRRNMFEGAHSLEELHLANVMADEVEADSFERLTSLHLLDISGNSINARRMNSIRLPASLRELNISHNNLSNEKGIELGAEFIQQVNSSLQVLDLSSTHFRLVNTSSFFAPLKHLRQLYLDANELSTVGTTSFPERMITLEMISMSHNRFDVLPEHSLIAKFAPNLQTLSLAHNQIKQIRARGLANLTALQRLDLSYNRISVIESHAFSGLLELTSLDLTGNVLRSLAADVFIELERVQHISLASNWLQFVPNNLLKVTTNSVAFASSLQTLDLDHNPMIRLREDLSSEGNFASLQTLHAQHGNITIVASHDFVGFSSLVRLYLEDNQIQTISPSAFRPLDRLVELDLSRNKLDNLPEERLGGLRRLEVLNLSSNSLTELPHFAPDLSNLRTIDISFNKIARIESFGHLSGSVSEISLRHNIISWIANNAFQNMSSLARLDLRQNFLTQIGEAIFESIEVRLQSIQLAGNPLHCDCRLLSIYEWLEEHSRVVKLSEEEEMVCDQPEKLKHQSIQSLQPIDFCPIPMITSFDVLKVEPSSVRLGWQVQNETLVGGFTLEYYLTSERSLTSPAGLQLNPAARTAELRDLVAEKWYTVCVEANGKYLRASSPSASSLEASFSKPSTAFMSIDHHPQKHLLQDFVTSNRKCSQVRTLSSVESRKLIAIPAASIIIAIGLFFVLILCVCVLAFILFRFRKKRRIQRQRSATVVSFSSIKPTSIEDDLLPAELAAVGGGGTTDEYVTYRHFSLPSNENVYS